MANFRFGKLSRNLGWIFENWWFKKEDIKDENTRR